MAEIGEDAEPTRGRFDHEANAVRRVVRRGNRVHAHRAAAELEHVPRPEMPQPADRAEVVPGREIRRLRAIHRDVKKPVISPRVARVVGVIVRKQQRRQAVHLQLVLPHPQLRPPGADSGVKHQPHAVGLDVEGVAVGAGLEGEGSHAS